MRITKKASFALGIITLIGGSYILLLVFYPQISFIFFKKKFNPQPISAEQISTLQHTTSNSSESSDIEVETHDTTEDAESEVAVDTRPYYDVADTLVIEKIGVVLDIIESPYSSALEKGSWHRHPERGNPEISGNFILTGHRFGFDWTPQGIARNSALYHIDKLDTGDQITVYWNHHRYDYEITSKMTVEPTDDWIEAPSDEPKLTIYTCTLGGEYDGRVVLTAKPIEL